MNTPTLIVEGLYFDGKSSRAMKASLRRAGAGSLSLRVTLPEAEPTDQLLPYDPKTVRLSERVGNIPRRLTFVDGAYFETDDNAAMDALFQDQSTGLVSWLERRWSVALISLIVVIGLSVVLVRVGIPALAEVIAAKVPDQMLQELSENALESLDSTVLGATTLTRDRQKELVTHFRTVTRDGGPYQYKLEFRSAPEMGPNALALPSGLIVLTDELVNIAKNDEELLAVLAHEVGHVKERHAMRHVVQSMGISALALAVLGDVGSVSAILSAAPALLDAKFSRDFETSADRFALHWLENNGIARERFDAILCRMTDTEGSEGGATNPLRYLSTHPATAERAHCSVEVESVES